MSERDIFTAAREITDPVARGAYLDEACGADTGLRSRIEALLRAHNQPDSLLDHPAVAPHDPESATTRTVGREGDAAADDEPLTFLAPPTRPDSLGRLGHYEVLQVLGRGGFGIVFRAFDEILQRVVALKVMAPQLAATSPARKRFLREARSSAQVRHENVVQVYEVAEQPLPYLAMEFIPGETLQQRLDRTGPLEVHEVLRVGRQIAEGLAAAHATDLIHRDIKPGNVLLEGGHHKVKITDFGLARAADDASISQSGIIAGTPMYMAPEQALGQTLDQRADLFSLGSVLYQMVAGRPPFRANGTLAVLKRVAEDKPRAIREIIPETPQWLCDIIAKLHAKDPDDRYQSAREAADVLADCEAQLKANAKLKDYSRIPRNHPQRSGRRKWVAVAAAVLLTVIALIVTEFAGVTHLFRGQPTAQSQRPLSSEPLISVGGSSTAAGCWFTWSNGYEKENADGSPSVGVYFGTATPPGRPTELLYLVLYKHAPKKSSSGGMLERTGLAWPGTGAGPVEIVDGLTIDGVAVKLSARLDTDESTGKLTREEYTFNEQKTALSTGRVFLVDLTVSPAKWQQVNVELPRDLPRGPITREIVRRVAEDEVPALRKKHSAVDDFFKARALPAAPARDTSVRTESGAKDKPSSPAIAPFTDADVQRMAALPAALQVEEVRKELIRRNPRFDGQVESKIENGVVTRFKIVTDQVTDIAPIRVFSALQWLACIGTDTNHMPNGQLEDLTPLEGMNLAPLTHLWLENTQVGDAGLAIFKDCKNLQELHLWSTKVTDAGLVYFKDCKTLAALNLGATRVSDAGLVHFQDCKALTRLNLAWTKVSDAGLAHFKGCKNLTQLWVNDNTQVGDAGIAHFHGCKDLTDLNLAGTKVSDVGLAHFKDCKNLKFLWLDRTQVGDAGLAHFKGIALRALSIDNTAITDLTPLQGMPLEEIRLTPKNITKGLDILRDMKSLKTIGIAWRQTWPAAEFWERYDKGEFKE